MKVGTDTKTILQLNKRHSSFTTQNLDVRN